MTDAGDCRFLLVQPGPHVVIIGRRAGDKTFHLVCFGRKRHYRQDGTCAHTETVMARLRPRIRKRTRVTPFGARNSS
jgi:hypothetical protein